MKRYAHIKNGVVVNISVADENWVQTEDTIDITELPQEISIGWLYNGEEFEVNPVSTPATRRLSKFEFRSKFTLNELVLIDNAAANPGLDTTQKRILNTIAKNFDAAEYIDLSHPAVIQGMEYLVSCGLLTQERLEEIIGQ